MITLEIEGVDVQVESEADLRKLKSQLDAVYQKKREKEEEKERLPEKILSSIDGLMKSHEKSMDAAISEIKKIKPTVTVSAPDVKVAAPVVNVPAPVVHVDAPTMTMPKVEKVKPIKKVTCTNIERDWKGEIIGAEFEVKR